MNILQVENISKNYRNIRALKNVSFSVPQGSVFGILGPNGSGKTTTLGIVMDILKPSDGSYKWFEQTPSADLRKHIGTLLETPNFYHYLSGRRNLEIAAAIKQKGQDSIDEVLAKVNLLERAHSKFSTYSLGMKQRLAIASTLLGNPSVLVFDEPTNGLDPVGIAEIRELIKQLAQEGKTVIMASHILDEVEKVCTHAAILQKGEMKAIGTVNEILEDTIDNSIIIEVGAENLQSLAEALKDYHGIKEIVYHEQDKLLHLVCEPNVASVKINEYCFNKGVVLNKLSLKRRTLEKSFLEITGKQAQN